jgi:UDP-glucose 4-epimerase
MYKNILITGGLGYIGSHLIDRLNKTFGSDMRIIVIDNLVNSYPNNQKGFIVENIDINNLEKLDNIFAKYKIDFAFHLAALADARESQIKPFEYFNTNVGGTINVLKCIQKYNLKRFLFTSSCSIFGNTIGSVSEETTPNPISIYGKTKLICENIIKEFSNEYQIESIVLRLFNVAGAHSDGRLGENSKRKTRIVTSVCNSVLQNKTFSIFGKNYETKDGTCGRDYIHVEDVAEICEIIMLTSFFKSKFNLFNIGSNNLITNLDIVNEVENVTNQKINLIYEEGDNADPSSVHANIDKLIKHYNWKPRKSSLNNIITTSWKWFSKINGID